MDLLPPGRAKFWWWALFCLLGGLILGVISHKLSAIFSLATLVPYLAVAARRLHDTDRSGWLQLVGLIPFVGWLVLIYWLAQESKSGSRWA
ncbi:DUF805 domain-containing protein [Ideonella sp. B7]|nr:DUF805 domain-containing protein [Ideonella benzenivorans]